MRVLLFEVFVLLLVASCTSQPSSTPVPLSPTPKPSPTATATATPTPIPTPTPTFAPGPVILPTVGVPTGTPTSKPADPLDRVLNTVGLRTNVLRELFSVKPVDIRFISRDEMRVMFREYREEDRDDLYEVQELYVTLGILDRDVSLFDLMLALDGEGVLGFFDSEEEELYVVKDAPEFGPNDALTYAHEFVHNLQQQHFDIHSISEELEDNFDRGLAFRAVVEGDASLSESLYLFQHMDEEEVAAVREAYSKLDTQAFESAPYVIQRTRIFPYREGLQFVFLLLRDANGWDLVNQAFQDLPQSTEQILHPEKYTSSEEPVSVELPDLTDALGQDWSRLGQDTLGEFFLMAHLETGVSPERAAAAAAGWGGDSYVLFKGPEDANLLASLITWDSGNDAQEFFDTFIEFMPVRTNVAWEPPEGDEGSRVMNLPDQIILIKLDADDTQLIFAPDAETLETVRIALDGT